MCGIAGIFGDQNRESISEMMNVMAHRGPDHNGTFFDHSISMGMVRLSIIDTSSSANQPMISQDGDVILIYNGEMYNFPEEKKALEKLGYEFQSNSDTEVVLKLYLHYGLDFLNRIRGMFALAIYDKRDHNNPRLLLARDPLGIKPLLFSWNENKLIFASELKAMLKSGYVHKKINFESLRQLFTYGSVKQPGTMISDVHMLLPGHYLVCTEEHREYEIKKYSPNYFEPDHRITALPYEGQKELVYETLLDSVKKHLVSDVPIGAFLSGGIDSSLIVSLMTQVLGKQVQTFSVGFEGIGLIPDESDDARNIAEHLHTDHHSVTVTGEDFNKDLFHIVRSLDQPSVDGVNSYYVSKAAADTVRVSLSGTGGDELFTGYPWFLNMLNFTNCKKNPFIGKVNEYLFHHGLFNKLANGNHFAAQVAERYRRQVSFLSHFSRLYLINPTNVVKNLFHESVNSGIQYPLDIAHDYLDIYDESINSTINQVSNLCINGYLRNQLLRDIDVMSMAHSLEVRVPFVDSEVLKLAVSLSDEAKIREGATMSSPSQQTYRELGSKKVLIDLGKRFLPEDYDKQPKRGFSLPFGEWMKEHCNEIIRDVFSEDSVKNRGLLNSKTISHYLESYKNGHFRWTDIWLILSFELWCREYLDA